ncbi:MAG: hypothetical protein IJW21_05515 [Clostridia bacterium]|nr:hypothetical protein [Clostridia bacterium]
MIIREYKKSLMVVKNIESDIISEAYFILKCGADEQEEKISAEAERIIRECGGGKKKRRAAGAVLACFCAAAGVFALAALGAFLYAQFMM